ncbi:MAG: Ig-like domain-containing protein, partial [Candidatus Symbiothrix sp.]|nr:Ig-like domain-containing protein [Candidatus Symbiothrix sp.]
DISGITINGSTDLITAVARALSNTQLRINHAALAQGTEYTVVIPAGAVVGYEQEITWSFTTIAALVADVKPADGATNVAIDAPLVVGFNRATLAPRGISFAALTIKADGSDESIADITTNWNDTRDTITISHPALEYNTHYTVNIPRGLIIEANDYASEITWSFTTEIEPLVGAWLETFESRTELPAAWTTTLGGIFGTTKYWNLAAAYSRYTAQGKPAIFDDHFVWFDGYANSKNFAANLFTPQFTPTAADHTLTYDVAEALVGDLPSDRNAAGLQLYVEVSTDGGATYIASTDNVLASYPNHNSATAPDPAAVPYNYTLDLAAYVDQAINVRFRAVSDLGAYVVALDNVGVKTTEVVTGTIVSPEEGAEGVELDEPIIVVFDKSVNTNGAADFSNAVLISENENEIPLVAEISADGTEVVFTHVDLEYASAYTILIPAASVVGLAEDIVSGFSTKLSPLTIESKTPAADATDVELDATIAVTFSRTISLNNVPGVKATVKDADGVAVDGVSLTADGAVLTVNHADLAPATVYTVNIIDVAIAGWFEAITWSFTTKNDVGIHAPQSSVSVYPTISKGNITVAAPVDAKITIVDVLGNALATYHSLGQTPISLNYTNGIYVVVVENKNTVSTHKVILKK